MSKIGKKPIPIPNKVEVKIDSGFVSTKGPKGELRKPISKLVEVSVVESNVIVKSLSSQTKQGQAEWGLARALLSNMIKGVTEGFEKVLEFQGVGYKANVKPARPDESGRSGGGDNLELGLGFSHPVLVPAPEGISFIVEKNVIKISGVDKDLVGQVAARIRSFREPEPYKGSGIRYRGEFIRRKAGKKAVAAG